jgi:Domain of unknown function (DUF4189)
MTNLAGIVALTAVVALVASAPACADGALAIGSTTDIAHDGIAIGVAINQNTAEEATEAALQSCRSFKGAPKAAATCQSVGTFKGQCYAISFDPRRGVPGTVGWAIAATKAEAEEQALAKCKAAAASRGAFCKVEESRCDQS